MFGANMKKSAVYIMSNKKNGTIYVGVTSDLMQRIHQHKNNLVEGFTKKHGCKNLVYYELFDDIINAITREKQIKAGSRDKKIKLIQSINFDWSDLYDSIYG